VLSPSRALSSMSCCPTVCRHESAQHQFTIVSKMGCRHMPHGVLSSDKQHSEHVRSGLEANCAPPYLCSRKKYRNSETAAMIAHAVASLMALSVLNMNMKKSGNIGRNLPVSRNERAKNEHVGTHHSAVRCSGCRK
jgi:hypothetical protein